MEKNYELLKPFDLEAAKDGAPICWFWDGQQCRYVAGPNSEGGILVIWEETIGSAIKDDCVTAPRANLRMAPLCWVEGRPVYRGDELYFTGGLYGDTIIIDDVTGDSFPVAWEANKAGCVAVSSLTWSKPKKLHQVWINLYKDGSAIAYEGKGLADSNKENRVDCRLVEWKA